MAFPLCGESILPINKPVYCAVYHHCSSGHTWRPLLAQQPRPTRLIYGTTEPGIFQTPRKPELRLKGEVQRGSPSFSRREGEGRGEGRAREEAVIWGLRCLQKTVLLITGTTLLSTKSRSGPQVFTTLGERFWDGCPNAPDAFPSIAPLPGFSKLPGRDWTVSGLCGLSGV